ncbi:LuxR C-terminal-related transcriptional regulator [Actinoplanes sp. TFC3]|uniref:LuxR C-terminal-related transcriptional regulator n=1 Tax=Actinoplanes sp. TFC3 TaxID=1710355 RepID=UPI00191BDAF3|nr:LuxR C-terminal-related transcriptional regulator [Actinoplanes sp. TFC3]
MAHRVAMGLTNTAIAGKLDVSPLPVPTHLRRISAKLDVPTRAAMVAVIADSEPPDLAPRDRGGNVLRAGRETDAEADGLPIPKIFA